MSSELWVITSSVASAFAAAFAGWNSYTSTKLAKMAIKKNDVIAENARRIQLLSARKDIKDEFEMLTTRYRCYTGGVDEAIINRSRHKFSSGRELFGYEINEYLNLLLTNLSRHHELYEERRTIIDRVGLGHEQTLYEKQVSNEYNELCSWLSNQHREGLELFRKHMELIE